MKEIKMISPCKIVPPGINPQNQLFFFMFGNIVSLVISLLFFVRYYNEYIKQFNASQEYTMPDFYLILDGTVIGFVFVAIFMMFYVIYYYSYYKNGSMSIYMMKRLPNRFEIHKTAWTLPLLTAFLTLIIGFLISVFYLGFYLIITPNELLTPNQWQKFLHFIIHAKG